MEKEMATHSSILAWRIPWTEEGYNPQDCNESDMIDVAQHREQKMTLNICNMININIFILFMMKRVQRAGDGDITGGGKTVPLLQKTPINYTQKRSRSPQGRLSHPENGNQLSEFASSSHSYRAYTSFSRCWQVKLLFQFLSRFLT